MKIYLDLVLLKCYMGTLTDVSSRRNLAYMKFKNNVSFMKHYLKYITGINHHTYQNMYDVVCINK